MFWRHGRDRDNAQEYKDVLAMTAAALDYTRGREWRPTGYGCWSQYSARGKSSVVELAAWAGLLLRGRIALAGRGHADPQDDGQQEVADDFVKIFLGKGGNTGPLIVTYTFDELVQDLNQVVPYDWAKFLHDRVDKINPHVDVAGMEQGGYRLVFKDEPTKSERMMTAPKDAERGVDCWYSIGLRLGADGTIADVLWNGPADKAGLAPGEKIMAANDKVFSGDALRDAIRDAKDPAKSIHGDRAGGLLCVDDGY